LIFDFFLPFDASSSSSSSSSLDMLLCVRDVKTRLF
tara:strand:- start:1225 stop:1332 length:108 start_codon:yes stop_codon:yes gene_type:complete